MDSPASFTISSAESLAFAALTGDFNPIHVDPVAARRLMFGGTVLHGVHVCLKAIEVAVIASAGAFVLDELKAQFTAPTRAGQAIDVRLARTHGGRLRLQLFCEQQQLQTIAIHPGAGDLREIDVPDRPPSEGQCRELHLAEVALASGAVPIALDRQAAAALFPVLVRAMPVWQVASLLATTRIVGMRCPGLHSLFTGLHVRFREPDGSLEPTLAFRVASIDERFSLAELLVAGPGVEGELQTLVRPAPVLQASFPSVQHAVANGEFAGQRALVVGGSRGLGELAAKIIAAGGGEVAITYATGRDDAIRVYQEIREGGGSCRMMVFDVLAPDREALTAALCEWRPTHLHYFATPHIQLTDPAIWREDLFRQFSDYYVTGLFRTLSLVQEISGSAPLTLINPSTVFLERAEPQAKEYSAAKAAAETLCRDLAANHLWLSSLSPRLPRLDTDQTSSFMAKQPRESGLRTILGVLRAAAAGEGQTAAEPRVSGTAS